MKFPIRYIFSLIIGLCVCLAASPKVKTPMRLPAAHNRAVETIAKVSPLMSADMDDLRQASPFAMMAFETADTEEQNPVIEQLTDYAASFLGTRYRLGASGPSRFDCSGFTSYIFKNFGFKLNRDSRSQYQQGQKVGRDELKPGDLLFFSSRSSGRGRVGHVAMVTEVNPDGSCTFIHASTKYGVTYQKFPDGGYYSRNYLGAKRIIGSI